MSHETDINTILRKFEDMVEKQAWTQLAAGVASACTSVQARLPSDQAAIFIADIADQLMNERAKRFTNRKG